MPNNQRWIAAFVALSLGGLTAPSTAAAATPGIAASAALPAALFKKGGKKKKKKKKKKGKKKSSSGEKQPSLTTSEASEQREAIRAGVAETRESDKIAAAEALESGAAELGDPVTMMEAGELRLDVAREERDIDEAQASIDTNRQALDILYFYDSVGSDEAHSDWLVIAPNDAGAMIADAQSQIDAAEELIEEIEAENDEPEAVADAGPKKKKKKRGKAKPGTGFIIGGSVAAAAGLAGVGLAFTGMAQSRSAQNEAEDLNGDPANQMRIDELDEKGGQANRLAYIGMGLGAVGLAVGIPLIVVGVKKRKAAGPSSSARVNVAPVVAGRTRGLAISGRF